MRPEYGAALHPLGMVVNRFENFIGDEFPKYRINL
jgi:hypothetical protein